MSQYDQILALISTLNSQLDALDQLFTILKQAIVDAGSVPSAQFQQILNDLGNASAHLGNSITTNTPVPPVPAP